MRKSQFNSRVSVAALALAVLSAQPAFAQDAAPAADAETVFGDEIVVTASAGNKSKIESSVSVTDISAELIAAQAPRSDAEIFKLIPGIRAESTAGPGGNSNITVRGLPLASGGSKYVQLQEDGVAVVEFGDIAFGNNDYWTKYDWTVDTIQAIRGGSSSTLASQAPGAVINYVSKTGEKAGGRIGLTTGLGYDEKRLDFNYGSPITDTLRFNVGGFYRYGKGPRDIPYKAMDGYQIKANITKTFDDDKGYIRLNFKRLDDRSPTYTASPFEVTVKGNTITGYKPLAGFDSRKDTNFSLSNLTFPVVNSDGSIKTGSNREGIHVKSTSFGVQFHYDISDNFTIDNKFAKTNNSGIFSAPFFGDLTTAGAITTGASAYKVTTSDGQTFTAATARYANGPLAGGLVPAGTVIDRNPNLYTDMNDMGRVGNDLGLTGTFDAGSGKVTARAGYYYSSQDINMDWHWNNTVRAGVANQARVDLFAADGTKLTDNGLTGYNNQWGQCCVRNYDLNYTDNAPYLALNYANDKLDLDVSVRHDMFKAGGEFRGTLTETVPGDGNGDGIIAVGETITRPDQVAIDIDGNGVLSVAERNSFRSSTNPTQIVNYKLNYTSWSGGANYRVTPDLSVFIRASQGYRANADRVVSGDYGNILLANGSISAGSRPAVLNKVTQQELGLKTRGALGSGRFGVNVTAFRSQALEFNYDLTKAAGQQISFQSYKTSGLEFESIFSTGGFNLNANAVYTHSRISKDLIGGNTGNTPRATPTLAWTVSPSYDFGIAAVGVTMVGQTKTNVNDDNKLKQRGQNIFSAFVRVEPIAGLEVSANVNNLFNSWDQAGRLDQGSVADLAGVGALFGVPYAATNRVGLGRTFSASASYKF